MTLALLCSGQGTQHAGMFALTGDVPAAAGIFARAATLLGRDPRKFVRTAGGRELHLNRVAQILCSLQALAASAALRDAMPERLVVAGYSVGELAAWGVAGALDTGDTLDLAARRSEVMDGVAIAGDGMLSVRGLSRAAMEQLCAQYDVAIAIFNPGDAFIVGGSGSGLAGLAARAEAMHAVRVVRLPVTVASHTKRMAAASPVYRDILGKVSVQQPRAGTRLLSGIDGGAVVEAAVGLDKLAAQVSQSVNWTQCLRSCVEAGATAFLELGPGRALSTMLLGMIDDSAVRSLDDFRTLHGVREWLARHAAR